MFMMYNNALFSARNRDAGRRALFSIKYYTERIMVYTKTRVHFVCVKRMRTASAGVRTVNVLIVTDSDARADDTNITASLPH